MFTRHITVVLAVAFGVAAQGTGTATWYNPGLGACAITKKDSDMVVAVSAAKLNNFRSNCNWQIRISHGGHTVVARITDRCAHCDGASLDMSPAVFSSFAPLNLGRLENVEWSFA